MKYTCSRCGDERMFDDDIHYAGVHKCKNCGGYYTPMQEDAKDGDEEE